MKNILSLLLSFVIGFITYPFSFSSTELDTDFTVSKRIYSVENIYADGKNTTPDADGMFIISDSLKIIIDDYECGWFNYYGISYSSDSYLKGKISYRAGVKEKSEEFFVEPGTDMKFYSFIDNYLKKTKADAVISVELFPLDKEISKVKINGVSVFNRNIPDREVYVSNQNYKIGVDLLWGGALSYVEDLNSNVQAVKHNGRIKVDSDASKRYNTASVNDNVNLINRYDPGRLVQQSYYGTFNCDEYESGIFMDNVWNYNPVQGGNQFGDSSKIVDLRIDDSSIYIKCRPLDWAKEKEHITPSYMEATYKIEGNLVSVSCRFIDFSGYPDYYTSQEIPAFYCIEPFNRYVYYSGDKPWTNDTLSVEPELIFWPDAGYPNFDSTENWSAFIGEYDDSFGIGIYVPDETRFLAGVFDREKTTNHDPSKDFTTSYIALIKYMNFASYSPIEYEYYISTGNIEEIRSSFSTLN